MMRQRRRQSTITLVACCNGNKKAYVLDPSNGHPTGTEFSTPSGLWRGSQISSTEAILGGDSDNTSVLSLTSGTVTKTMTGGHNGGNVLCTANLVSDDVRVATGATDNCIPIWDVNAGSVITKLQGHTSGVYSLVNHPFLSQFLFSGSYDSSIKQWDHNQETCVKTFKGHTGNIQGLCYDPTHQIVFSGSDDKTVKGWDHKSGENVITLTLPNYVECILSREESEENQLVVPVYGEKNHLYDLRLFSENGTTQELRSWNHGHSGSVYDICDVPDQNMFVTSGWSDYHIEAWRENGTCVWDWRGPSHMYGLISFVDDYEEFISTAPLPPPLPPPPTEEELHISELTSQLHSLTSERDELLIQVSTLTSLSSASEAKIMTLEETNDALEKRIATSETEKSALEEVNQDQGKKLVQVTQELTHVTQERDEFRSEVNEFEQLLSLQKSKNKTKTFDFGPINELLSETEIISIVKSVILSEKTKPNWIISYTKRLFDVKIQLKKSNGSTFFLPFLTSLLPLNLKKKMVQSEDESNIFIVSLDLNDNFDITEKGFLSFLFGSILESDEKEFSSHLLDYYRLFITLELPLHAYFVCQYLVGNVKSMDSLLYYLRLGLEEETSSSSSSSSSENELKTRLLNYLHPFEEEEEEEEEEEGEMEENSVLSLSFGMESPSGFVVACLNGLRLRAVTSDGEEEENESFLSKVNSLFPSKLITDHIPKSLLSLDEFASVGEMLSMCREDDDDNLSFDLLQTITFHRLYDDRGEGGNYCVVSEEDGSEVRIHGPILLSSGLCSTDDNELPEDSTLRIPDLSGDALELLVQYHYLGTLPDTLWARDLASLFSLVRYGSMREEVWTDTFLLALTQLLTTLKEADILAQADLVECARALHLPTMCLVIMETLSRVFTTVEIFQLFPPPPPKPVRQPNDGPPEQQAGIYIDPSKVTLTNQVLGEGAFGKVVVGRLRAVVGAGLRTEMEIPVAAKIIRLNANTTKSAVVKEVTLMSEIDHPNCLKCHGCWFEAGTSSSGQEEELAYVILELCEKEDVFEWIQKNQPDDELKLKIILQIALAIEHLHEKGIIHRDIKPDNVLMTIDGIPKLCDFGISRHEASMKMTVCGTPSYMPNPTHAGYPDKRKMDSFAFGMMCYELLFGQKITETALYESLSQESGQNPFTFVMLIHTRGVRPSFAGLTVSDDLQSLLEDCWADHPKDRPLFTDIVDRLSEMIGSSPTIKLMDGTIRSLIPSDRGSTFTQQNQSPVHSDSIGSATGVDYGQSSRNMASTGQGGVGGLTYQQGVGIGVTHSPSTTPVPSGSFTSSPIPISVALDLRTLLERNELDGIYEKLGELEVTTVGSLQAVVEDEEIKEEVVNELFGSSLKERIRKRKFLKMVSEL